MQQTTNMKLPFVVQKCKDFQNFIRSNKLLVLLFFVFCGIRIGLPILYPGSYIDEWYHLLSGHTFAHFGHFAEMYLGSYYFRGAYVSFFTAIYFKLFGESVFVAKLVPATIGIIDFVLVYLVGKQVFSKKFQLLLLLAIFTLSPWIILNHFYIRMYAFYETFSLFVALLALNTVEQVEQKNVQKLLRNYLILGGGVVIGNFLSQDNVFLILASISLLTFYVMYLVYCTELLSNNSFIQKLFSRKTKIYTAVIGMAGIITSFIISEKIREKITVFLQGDTATIFHFNTLGHVRFFFEQNGVLSILAVIFLILYLLQPKKEKKLNVLVFMTFVFLAIHFLQSRELQLVRTVSYFLPIFCVFSVALLDKLKRPSQYLTAFILIAFTLTSFPSNFFTTPQIPNEGVYLGGKIYSAIEENCNSSLLITSLDPGILQFYHLHPDYELHDYLGLGEESYTYSSITERYINVYSQTPVINHLSELSQIYADHQSICYLERTPVIDIYLTKESQAFIEKNFYPIFQDKNLRLLAKPSRAS